MITAKEFPALKERARALLKDELGLSGFSEDSDGDFSFNYERTSFDLIFDTVDPAFLWLRDSSPYWLSDPAELSRADSCINEVNRTCKVVKMFRSAGPNPDGNHWVAGTASIIVDDVSSLSVDTFDRCLYQIKVGKREFFNLFHESPPTLEPERRIVVVGSPIRH